MELINYNKLLNEYRNKLIELTEEFQERAKDPNNSKCGEHFERGHVAGFIRARAELEDIFKLWDNI